MANKELTEIEQSWQSGEFENDLHALDKQITKEVWAHDVYQAKYKREDMMWKIFLTSLNIFSVVLIAAFKEYIPSSSDLVSEISLGLSAALMMYYTWRDPAGKRAVHILVSGQKSDTQGKIRLQLIQKPKYRELADTFYKWIHSEFARVGGVNDAYLPASLLAKYPDPDTKKPKNE